MDVNVPPTLIAFSEYVLLLSASMSMELVDDERTDRLICSGTFSLCNQQLNHLELLMCVPW